MKKRQRILLIGYACVAFWAGCALLRGSPYMQVDGVILASKNLNLDYDNIPHSVTLRLYFLREAESFRTNDVRTLWKDDRAVLQTDLVEQKEMIIFPNKLMNVQFDQIEKDAAYVGVLADYIRPDGELTKSLHALGDSRTFLLGMFEHRIKLKSHKR